MQALGGQGAGRAGVKGISPGLVTRRSRGPHLMTTMRKMVAGALRLRRAIIRPIMLICRYALCVDGGRKGKG